MPKTAARFLPRCSDLQLIPYQSKGLVMPTHKAEAEWKGNLAQGSGRLKLGSGAFDGPYSFKSRFEEGQAATNPEELIGAAHAGCFSMALAAQLSRAGLTPTRIHTTAQVKLEKIGDAFPSPASTSPPKRLFPASTTPRFKNTPSMPNKTAPSP